MRRKNHKHPAIAAIAIKPTTTPTAIPTVLGPDLGFEVGVLVPVGDALAVTTMVELGRVVLDGGAVEVEVGEVETGVSDAAGEALLTLDVNPVTYTEKKPAPPPITR